MKTIKTVLAVAAMTVAFSMVGAGAANANPLKAIGQGLQKAVGAVKSVPGQVKGGLKQGWDGYQKYVVQPVMKAPKQAWNGYQKHVVQPAMKGIQGAGKAIVQGSKKALKKVTGFFKR